MQGCTILNNVGKKDKRRSPSPEQLSPQTQEYEERVALRQAYAGVVPLNAPIKRHQPLPEAQNDPAQDAQDAQARAELHALVNGGIRFVIKRDEHWVQGVREGINLGRKQWRNWRGQHISSSARLDLHGCTRQEAEKQILAHIRHCQRRHQQALLIIHGKGHHSEDGMGVLRDHVLQILTQSVVTRDVLAFETASAQEGGSGALRVWLKS